VRFTRQRQDRAHAELLNPARHDQAKQRQIGAQIEGEAMHRHPTRNAHADRADLHRRARGLLAAPTARVGEVCPQADVLLDHAAVNAVALGETHHHAIQIFDVATHVHAIRVQIQNGIADELPRRVQGHVPAPAGRDQGDASLGQRSLGGQ